MGVMIVTSHTLSKVMNRRNVVGWRPPVSAHAIAEKAIVKQVLASHSHPLTP